MLATPMKFKANEEIHRERESERESKKSKNNYIETSAFNVVIISPPVMCT